jgi:hypothetical protein
VAVAYRDDADGARVRIVLGSAAPVPIQSERQSPLEENDRRAPQRRQPGRDRGRDAPFPEQLLGSLSPPWSAVLWPRAFGQHGHGMSGGQLPA